MSDFIDKAAAWEMRQEGRESERKSIIARIKSDAVLEAMAWVTCAPLAMR